MAFDDPFLDALDAERTTAHLVARQAREDRAYVTAVAACARLLLATELLARCVPPEPEPEPSDGDVAASPPDPWAEALREARQALRDATYLALRQERFYAQVRSWFESFG